MSWKHIAAVAAVVVAGLTYHKMSMVMGSDVVEEPTPPTTAPSMMDTPLKFKMKDIDGKDVDLASYKGKVVLIVNVASKCGFTPQYAGLESIYKKYEDKGLVVLGFPANNFGGQEPGSDAEIKTFCSGKYDVTFPVFSKISVKGADQHPLYKFLTEKETNGAFAGPIGWNFTKFLVDKNGHVYAKFASKTKPESPEMAAAIEKGLAG